MSQVFKLAPHEWARLRSLLDDALAMPPEQRAAWIDSLGSTQLGALGPQLRALLAHADEATPDTVGRLLETLPKIETGQFAGAPGAGIAQPGDTVGPYRLVRELGSGGMGVVWQAERTDLLQGRPVALKLPHGAWKRAGLAERMAREREILATLDHPNIARLYDAGVADDGQPWLALELVQGERIDVFCRHLALPVAERVRLALQVVRAVAHAHGRLVVHRDLKPGNVLVTQQDGVAAVKLLDFGIAKLVEQGSAEATALTQAAGRPFTPEYASPEQVLGEPLTTASDIYSLGVLLFELLADVRPYRLTQATRAALEEAIAQGALPRPSALAPAGRRAALRGDLDTIVLKALQRDPARRYATADALADDLQRHLDHRPVLARPDGTGYRLRLFVRRNRLAVAAGAVAAAGLLGGSALALWQAAQARAERDQALLHQRRASSFAEFMRVLLQDAGRPDQPLTPSQLLDRGVAMLERRTQQDDALAAHMWHELSRSYLLFQNTEREAALLERSAAAARRVGDHDQVAAAECSIAASTMVRDRAQATARLEAGRQALAARATPSESARLNCVRAEARLLQMQGRVADAVQLLQGERRRAQQQGGKVLADGLLRAALIDKLLVSDRADQALPLAEEILREVRAEGRQGSLAELIGISTLASVLGRLGEYRGAAEANAELIAWVRRPEMKSTAPMGVLTWSATPLLRLDRHAEALELALADQAQVQTSGNPSTIGLNHLARARALAGLGRLDEAQQALDAAAAQWSATHPGHARFRQEVAMDRAQLLLLQGRVDTAQQAIGAVLAGVGYPAQTAAPGIDRLLRLAARVALQGGRWAEAEALAADAATAARRQARGDDTNGDVGIARALRAQALLRLGRADEALRELRAARPALAHGLGADHAETRAVDAQLRAADPAAGAGSGPTR